MKVADEVASGKVKHGLGTHYVRSVTYGAELVARMSIKTSSCSERYVSCIFIKLLLLSHFSLRTCFRKQTAAMNMTRELLVVSKTLNSFN